MTRLLPLRLSGFARITLAATIWGSIGIFVRMVDAHPIVIVFWRIVFAGGTIAVIASRRKRLRALIDLSLRLRVALALMGALLALNWILFMGAIQLVDVAVAVLLAYCGPVFVAALTPLVTHEPFNRQVLIPLALALGGTAVIVSPAEVSLSGGPATIGATMAFASAITYALLILNAKSLLRGIPAVVYMLGEYTAAAILLLPAVFLLDGPSAPIEWGALLVLGVLNTAVAGLLFLSGLREVRADQAAILTYAEPVSAVAFAAAFLGESLTAATIAGGAAVLVAGLMVTRHIAVTTVEGTPVFIQPTENAENQENI